MKPHVDAAVLCRAVGMDDVVVACGKLAFSTP